MKKIFIFSFLALFINASFALADTLYGICVRGDGSKVNGSVKISTSWNSKVAFPRNGKYELDFDGSVAKTITVYVDGAKYATIYVNNNTRLDIVVR